TPRRSRRRVRATSGSVRAGGLRSSQPYLLAHGGRDRAGGFVEPFPRVATERREPAPHVAHVVRVGPKRGVELVPANRYRHRRALARAGREVGDRRRATTVAQVIEEHLAFALRLRDLRGEPLGIFGGVPPAKRPRERLDLVPV